MKLASRIVLSSLLSILVCLAVMPNPASAQETVTNDFTKDLGKWTVDKAEGKVEKDGLKITKVEQFGGILLDCQATDLSGAESITIDLQNASDKPIALAFKIGSGDKKVTQDFTVEAGKSLTQTFPLAGIEVDLKGVTYVKFFAAEAGAANLVIKKVAVVKAAGSQPASKPASQAAGANPFDVDFTQSMGKWKLDKAEGKVVAGEGLKLTDLKEAGGVILTRAPTDLTGLTVTVDMENTGKEAVALSFKIKSGTKAFTKDISVDPGKLSFKFDLGDASDVDLKKIDYMKIFGGGAVSLTIKKVSLAK